MKKKDYSKYPQNIMVFFAIMVFIMSAFLIIQTYKNQKNYRIANKRMKKIKLFLKRYRYENSLFPATVDWKKKLLLKYKDDLSNNDFIDPFTGKEFFYNGYNDSFILICSGKNGLKNCIFKLDIKTGKYILFGFSVNDDLFVTNGDIR